MPSLEPASLARPCRYCGAELDLRYGFCLRCAVPHAAARGRSPSPARHRARGPRRPRAPGTRPVPIAPVTPISSDPPDAPDAPDASGAAETARPRAGSGWTLAAVLLGAVWLGARGLGSARPDSAAWVGWAAGLALTGLILLRWRGPLFEALGRPALRQAPTWIAVVLLLPILALARLAALQGPELPTGTVGPWHLLALLGPVLQQGIVLQGALQPALERRLGPERAALATAALFALAQGPAAALPASFALGMLLCWTRWRTGSLLAPLAVHLVHQLAAAHFLS